MSDVINTITRNPMVLILVAFVVFCFIKGGNNKGNGKGSDGSSGSSGSSTPPSV